MDDALVVRGRERFSEPGGDLEHPLDRQPALGDQLVERLPLDKLHGQEVDAVRFLDGVHADDAGVIQRGQRFCLTLKPLEPLRVRGHLGGQHLEGHVPPKLGVVGAVDLAHAALAQLGGDLVVGEGAADHEVLVARGRGILEEGSRSRARRMTAPRPRRLARDADRRPRCGVSWLPSPADVSGLSSH